MTEKEKAEQDLQDKQKSIEDIKTQIIKLTADFRKNQYELNQRIFEQGKDEYSDINLEQLLVTGKAYHKGSISSVPFVLKTLTKAETLYIDKKSKEYLNESNDYYIGGIQTDSLAFVLTEYNNKKSPIDSSTPEALEKTFKLGRESVAELSSHVLDALWSSYSKMTRFVKAALELNLKN